MQYSFIYLLVYLYIEPKFAVLHLAYYNCPDFCWLLFPQTTASPLARCRHPRLLPITAKRRSPICPAFTCPRGSTRALPRNPRLAQARILRTLPVDSGWTPCPAIVRVLVRKMPPLETESRGKGRKIGYLWVECGNQLSCLICVLLSKFTPICACCVQPASISALKRPPIKLSKLVAY